MNQNGIVVARCKLEEMDNINDVDVGMEDESNSIDVVALYN